MSFLAPDFAPFLDPAWRAELDANAHTVVGLRPDNTIGYRNAAWDRFASDNGAPSLVSWNGTPIVEIFHPEIRDWYVSLFDKVRDSREPADHTYQCSSPAEYREFALRVLPLPARRLLLIHHLSVERAHHWQVHEPGSPYLDAHGIVTQCCHCRRTRRADRHTTWDWVPAYLEPGRPELSHGLCPPCFRHYHPRAAKSRDAALAGRQ